MERVGSDTPGMKWKHQVKKKSRKTMENTKKKMNEEKISRREG
jgi:hypothetical protein